MACLRKKESAVSQTRPNVGTRLEAALEAIYVFISQNAVALLISLAFNVVVFVTDSSKVVTLLMVTIGLVAFVLLARFQWIRRLPWPLKWSVRVLGVVLLTFSLYGAAQWSLEQYAFKRAGHLHL